MSYLANYIPEQILRSPELILLEHKEQLEHGLQVLDLPDLRLISTVQEPDQLQLQSKDFVKSKKKIVFSFIEKSSFFDKLFGIMNFKLTKS